MAKNKQKTHSATKKVLKKHKSGLITYMKSGSTHKTAKDSSKQVRQRRNKGVLSTSDAKRLKDFI